MTNEDTPRPAVIESMAAQLAEKDREIEQLRAAINGALEWCYKENVYGHVRNALELVGTSHEPDSAHCMVQHAREYGISAGETTLYSEGLQASAPSAVQSCMGTPHTARDPSRSAEGAVILPMCVWRAGCPDPQTCREAGCCRCLEREAEKSGEGQC